MPSLTGVKQGCSLSPTLLGLQLHALVFFICCWSATNFGARPAAHQLRHTFFYRAGFFFFFVCAGAGLCLPGAAALHSLDSCSESCAAPPVGLQAIRQPSPLPCLTSTCDSQGSLSKA